MKRFIWVLLLAFVLFGCGKKESASPVAANNGTQSSNGTVSSGAIIPSGTKQKVDSDIMERLSVHILGRDEEELVYDSSGKLEKVLAKNSDGGYRTQYEFTYDSSGRVHEIKENTGGNNYFLISTFERNNQGQKVKVQYSSSAGTGEIKKTGYTVIEYNSSGQRISDHSYMADGKEMDTYREYLYDSNGNRVTYYGRNTKTKQAMIEDQYEYDDKNRLKAAYSYSSGKLGSKMVYEYEGDKFKSVIIYTGENDKTGTVGYVKLLPESLYELQDY